MRGLFVGAILAALCLLPADEAGLGYIAGFSGARRLGRK